jgi:superfamily II DNA or RNA helicase
MKKKEKNQLVDEIRDKIQRESAEAWYNNKGIGTLELSTGVGKTIASFHCALKFEKEIKTILFLAEKVDRKTDLIKDIENYKKFFNIDLKKVFNITFSTYQSAYKWRDRKFDLVIADEIHFSLSPSYVAFYRNNEYKYIIGLSATLSDNVKYEDENGYEFSKKELLNEVSPIVYTYSIDQAQKDNASRKLNIFIIDHALDTTAPIIESGNKKNRFMQTEAAAYNYWDNQFKQSLFIPNSQAKEFRIIYTSRQRASLLYSLPSKVKVTKKLIEELEKNKIKTLVFGNSIDTLNSITDNTVSSKNSNKKNESIRKSFEEGKINTIGSFFKLEQGANLDGLDALILISYYGKTRPIIQRLGRIRKSTKKEEGFVFILKTKNTVEELKWFPKMTKEIDLSLYKEHKLEIDF